MSNEYLKYLFNDDLYVIQDSLNHKSIGSITKAAEPEETHEESVDDTHSESAFPKKVPVLIQAQFTSDSDRLLLEKVLEAVGLSMDQVSVVDKIEKEKYITSRYILFDDEIKSGYSYYQVKTVNQLEILFSRSLPTLHSSIEDKKALWTCLKNWFGIQA